MFSPRFCSSSFNALLSSHFYLNFIARSVEAVGQRGFLFLAILHNEPWMFVLGCSSVDSQTGKAWTLVCQFSLNGCNPSFSPPHLAFRFPCHILYIYKSWDNSDFFQRMIILLLVWVCLQSSYKLRSGQPATVHVVVVFLSVRPLHRSPFHFDSLIHFPRIQVLLWNGSLSS